MSKESRDAAPIPSRSVQYAIAKGTRAKLGSTPGLMADKRHRRFTGLRDVNVRPGAILQWDSTAGDVLLTGAVSGRELRMAVLTCMDVASRAIAEVAVIPRDPRAVDLTSVLFRMLMPRTFAPNDKVGAGYRYLGIPSVIHDVRDWVSLANAESPDAAKEFPVPALYPGVLHADGAGANSSAELREVLRRLAIDLEINRPGNSTDGSIIERAQQTLIPAYEMLPGYTAGTLTHRGKDLDLQGLVSPEQLQSHLRTYAFTVYNRRPHSAHVYPLADTVPHPHQPASPAAFSPVAMIDAHLQSGGAIDLPYRPDVLYDLLPQKRLKLNKSELEFNNIRYSGPWLDEIAALSSDDVPPEAAPDFLEARHVYIRYDPRDLTCVWIRHPVTGQIGSLPCMSRDLWNVPFSQDIADLIRERTTLVPAQTNQWNIHLAEAINDATEDARRRSGPVGHRTFQRRMDSAAHRYFTARNDHAAIDEALRTAPASPAAPSQPSESTRYPTWEDS